MTIHEIESILVTLRTQHPDLDEEMLVTLLSSAGWEKSVIQEAVALFSNREVFVHDEESDVKPSSAPLVSLPPIVESPVFTESIDTEHQLLEHNPVQEETVENEIVLKEESMLSAPEVTEEAVGGPADATEEPQSLMLPPEEVSVKVSDDELPHNLPLLPFETAPHVWSFSRYKDVFHGDTMPQAKEVAESLETKTATQPQIPTEVLQSPKVAVTPVPLTKKDEKLVALAATMLIIVVMLLAYMYSVGRL